MGTDPLTERERDALADAHRLCLFSDFTRSTEGFHLTPEAAARIDADRAQTDLFTPAASGDQTS